MYTIQQCFTVASHSPINIAKNIYMLYMVKLYSAERPKNYT